MTIPEPEAWPSIVDAVNGDPDPAKRSALVAARADDEELRSTLVSLVVFLARFVATLSAEHLTVLALWVAHTWVIEAAQTTPYVHLSSAEPESGKTRLLEVVELVAFEPLQVIDPSAATLFRGLDSGAFRTLLIDEFDNYLAAGKSDSEARGAVLAILNSGYRRGAVVPRCLDSRSKQIEKFDVFGPKILAGLREIPQTLASRSLRFRLQKRRPEEAVERFRRRRVEAEAAPLVDALKQWANETTIALLEAAEPELPDELSDREQDACEILVAIADLAGPDWGERARSALCDVAGAGRAAAAEQSKGIELLSDLRDAVIDLGRRLATSDVLPYLNALDERGWGGWNDGKGLTARNLARLLKPFGIKSRDIRVGDRAGFKGYRAEDLEDAFARYLPPPSATSATSQNQTRSSGSTEARHDHAVSPITTSPVPPGQGDVADVADGSSEYRYDGTYGSVEVTVAAGPATPPRSAHPSDTCHTCEERVGDSLLVDTQLGGVAVRACPTCINTYSILRPRLRHPRSSPRPDDLPPLFPA